MPQEPRYKDVKNPVEDQGMLVKTHESASFGESWWSFYSWLRRMNKKAPAQLYRKR